jgi:hypothetical protein
VRGDDVDGVGFGELGELDVEGGLGQVSAFGNGIVESAVFGGAGEEVVGLADSDFVESVRRGSRVRVSFSGEPPGFGCGGTDLLNIGEAII